MTTASALLSFLDHEEKEKGSETKNDGGLTRGTDEEILKLFYTIEELTVKEAEKLEDLQNRVLVQDATDKEKGLVVARAFEPLSKAVVKQIAELGITKIKVVDTSVDEGNIIKCLKKDPAKNEEEALKDIYRRLRPGDPADGGERPCVASSVCSLTRSAMIWDALVVTRSTRSSVSRTRKISRILTKNDLVAATKYLLKLKKGEGSLDDIDHLGSRRIRTVGQLLANQCRVWFVAHGTSRQGTHNILFDQRRRGDDAAEAHQPEGALGGHPRFLWPQPVVAVHGSN